MRLCGAFDEEHKVSCDLPAGHERHEGTALTTESTHRATIYWGDEDAEGEEDASD